MQKSPLNWLFIVTRSLKLGASRPCIAEIVARIMRAGSGGNSAGEGFSPM